MSPAFAIGDAIFDGLVEYGPYFIAIIGAIVLFLFIWSVSLRWFKYVKMSEHQYLDDSTYDLFHLILMFTVGIILFCLCAFLMKATFLFVDDYVWFFITHYLPSLLALVYIIFATIIISRAIRRGFLHIDKRLEKEEGEQSTTQQVLDYVEITLVYLTYLLGLIIALGASFALLPESDFKERLSEVVEYITPDASDWVNFGVILALLIALYFFDKAIVRIFDDYKNLIIDF